MKAARRTVRMVEGALKLSGQIPLTEKEELDRDLDAAFLDAKSKEIVEFRGRLFQRRFWPLEMSRSGKTVTEWGSEWIEISDG